MDAWQLVATVGFTTLAVTSIVSWVYLGRMRRNFKRRQWEIMSKRPELWSDHIVEEFRPGEYRHTFTPKGQPDATDDTL